MNKSFIIYSTYTSTCSKWPMIQLLAFVKGQKSTPENLKKILRSLGIFPSGMIRFQVTAFSGNASILLHYRPLIGLCILQDWLLERQFLEMLNMSKSTNFNHWTIIIQLPISINSKRGRKTTKGSMFSALSIFEQK